MSTAPYETGCFDSFGTNLHSETASVTSTHPTLDAVSALAVPSTYEAQAADSTSLHVHQPTNLPLGVSDLTLKFKDGTPIRRNWLPLYDEMPILFTVRFANRPEGVDEMFMNVIISELGKDSDLKSRSGSFSRYVKSTTFTDTVPIVTDAGGHSVTIEVGHGSAPNSGFHGGDGPYDVYMSFTPVAAGTQTAKSGAAAHEHDEDDADPVSQIDETLKYTLYTSKPNLLTCFFYEVSRFWKCLLGNLVEA